MFECFAASECGYGLDTNEDFYQSDIQEGVFVVADGLGGMPAGDMASRLVVETFVDNLRYKSKSQRILDSIVLSAVQNANDKLISLAQSDPSLTGIGSTLSALVIVDSKAKIVHIGDSRVYRFHDGIFKLLTKDHTLEGELGTLEVGTTVAERFKHLLTRTMGSAESSEPDIINLKVTANDIFIICTDGLSKSVSEDTFEVIVKSLSKRSAREICEKLITAAINHPCGDDVTVCVVKLM